MATHPRTPNSTPHQLLVPRRRLGTGRAGRAGRRAGPDRAGRHRPPRPLRRGPVHQRGRGGRPPPGHRDWRSSCSTRPSPDPDGVVVPPRRPTATRARRGRRPPAPAVADRIGGARAGPLGRARSAPGCPAIASRSRRTCAGSASAQRGPHLVLLARDAGRLAEPVPARLAGEPGRDEGRAALQPGAPRRAHRGPRRAVGLPRGRDRPAAAGRAIARARGRSRSATRRCSARRRSGDERLLHRAVAPPPARRRLARGGDRRRSPPSSGCRSSSPTTSTTPGPRTASSHDVLTAIRHGRTLDDARPTCAGRTASRT